MLSKTSFASVLALTALATAAPAFAGPVGSGLGLTEEVARRAARTVKVAAAGEACAASAKAQLEAHPAVASVSHGADHVQVTFHSAAAKSEHRSSVSAVVNRACG